MTTRRGFTLIELMIAVMLGSLVTYIAVAGLRVASQTVTAANRLALDNAIMRTGVSIALNEKDFWLSEDDPLDGNNAEGRQPLRAAPTGTPKRGLPFTPFSKAHTAGSYTYTADTYEPAKPWIPKEEASGWEPNAWTANESRGWAWGNLNERIDYLGNKPDKPQTFGRYHWFVAPDTSVTHHWQQRQLDGLKNTLGYFGLFDYLPANTPLMVYSKNSTTDTWSVSQEWCFVKGDVNYIGNDNRREGFNFANDVLHATNGNPFIIPNAKPANGTLLQTAFRRYATGISLSMDSNNNSISNIDRLLKDGLYTTDWLPQRPAHWPSLQVSSLRFIRTNTFVCLNRVVWVSPISGQPAELNFTSLGTNLRGARQQRKRSDVGWADPFVEHPTDDPNLDTY